MIRIIYHNFGRIPPPIEVGVFCQNYDKWHTVIKGTKTIDEYKKKQMFMEQKATEFYNKHKEAVEDWEEGEPVKVWFDMNDDLCIEYESGKWWHYNERGEWF